MDEQEVRKYLEIMNSIKPIPHLPGFDLLTIKMANEYFGTNESPAIRNKINKYAAENNQQGIRAVTYVDLLQAGYKPCDRSSGRSRSYQCDDVIVSTSAATWSVMLIDDNVMAYVAKHLTKNPLALQIRDKVKTWASSAAQATNEDKTMLRLLRHPKYGDIRSFMVDNDLWFPLRDIMHVFQMNDMEDARGKIFDGYKRTITSNRGVEIEAINLKGVRDLYFDDAVYKEKGEELRPFMTWLKTQTASTHGDIETPQAVHQEQAGHQETVSEYNAKTETESQQIDINSLEAIAPKNIRTDGVSSFENAQFGTIRGMLIDGEPWFVVADVCAALSVGNSSDALRRLDDDEKGVDLIETPGGRQKVAIINEPGLYHIVLSSRKPEAKAFRRWITHEVIPAIRKQGAYLTPQYTEQMTKEICDVIMNPGLLTKLRAELEDKAAEVEVLKKQIASTQHALANIFKAKDCIEHLCKNINNEAKYISNKAALAGEPMQAIESNPIIKDKRSLLNDIVRQFGYEKYNGDLKLAYRCFYNKLNKEHDIDTSTRKKNNEHPDGLIDEIREDEWDIAIQCAIDMCRQNGVNIDGIVD